MAPPRVQRTNLEWLTGLREPRSGHDPSELVGDLEDYLHRVLAKVVLGRGGGRFTTADLPELVQESLTNILASLESFRGDSAFLTWATAVATRVAFTELRRRRVREQRTDAFDAVVRDVDQLASPSTDAPGHELDRIQLLDALHDAITTELTERQRRAVLAELRGIPTVEIAARLGTNQNALYKLVHDARKKLRRALLASGFSAESFSAPEVATR